MPETNVDVITSIGNGIQKIILNRPSKKNAISSSMYKDIIKILKDSATNESVRMLVFTGAGDFYSSGNDFKTSAPEIDLVKSFIDTIILYPKLLVAVVNGPAIGISVTTLALFDMVYASEKAYFSTPFSSLGLVGEGCSTYTFPKIMGPSKAGDMLYLGRTMTAVEAEQCGLVSKVYKHFAQNEIWSYLSKVAGLSEESLLATKRLVKRWNQNDLLRVNEEEMTELEKRISDPRTIEMILKAMMMKSKI